jgi:hypothetical protein
MLATIVAMLLLLLIGVGAVKVDSQLGFGVAMISDNIKYGTLVILMLIQQKVLLAQVI